MSTGFGSYKLLASSTFGTGNEAYRAFNEVNTDYWACAANRYANQLYTGTTTTKTVTGDSYSGEWLQVSLPTSIITGELHLRARSDGISQAPSTFVLLGSFDAGVTWNLIHNQSTPLSWTTNGQLNIIQIPSTGTIAYSSFRIVITSVANAAEAITSIAECKIYSVTYYNGANINGNLNIGPQSFSNYQILRVAPGALIGNVFTDSNVTLSNIRINEYTFSNIYSASNATFCNIVVPDVSAFGLELANMSTPTAAFSNVTASNINVNGLINNGRVTIQSSNVLPGTFSPSNFTFTSLNASNQVLSTLVTRDLTASNVAVASDIVVPGLNALSRLSGTTINASSITQYGGGITVNASNINAGTFSNNTFTFTRLNASNITASSFIAGDMNPSNVVAIQSITANSLGAQTFTVNGSLSINTLLQNGSNPAYDASNILPGAFLGDFMAPGSISTCNLIAPNFTIETIKAVSAIASNAAISNSANIAFHVNACNVDGVSIIVASSNIEELPYAANLILGGTFGTSNNVYTFANKLGVGTSNNSIYALNVVGDLKTSGTLRSNDSPIDFSSLSTMRSSLRSKANSLGIGSNLSTASNLRVSSSNRINLNANTNVVLNSNVLTLNGDKLGIKTMSPSNILDVVGTTFLSNATLNIENGSLLKDGTNYTFTANLVSITAGSNYMRGSNAYTFDSSVRSAIVSYGSDTMVIPHPDASKSNYNLRHGSLATNTYGDNFYRYKVTVDSNLTYRLALPAYFSKLNNAAQVWVSSEDVLGYGRGVVNSNLDFVDLYTSQQGTYNVLVFGTRKDTDAMSWLML